MHTVICGMLRMFSSYSGSFIPTAKKRRYQVITSKFSFICDLRWSLLAGLTIVKPWVNVTFVWGIRTMILVAIGRFDYS